MSNFRNGRALLNLSVALIATTLVPLGGSSEALAGGRGGGTPPTYAFGLPHTALGGAALSLDPAGRLLVSNIGSSGQDGVSVDLGHTIGYAMACDIGVAGALADGSVRRLTSHFQDGDIPSQTELRFAESGTGQCDVLLSYTGPAATCTDVELRLAGAVVASARMVHPPGSPPGIVATGSIGSHDDGSGLPPSPPVFEVQCDSGDTRLDTHRPPNGVWTVALPGSAPVQCDELSITLHGLPPGQRVLTQCDVQCSDIPGGEQSVAKGEIKIKHKGWDGLIYHRTAATGQAHISGVAGPDICAGCPECCEPSNGDPLDLVTGVDISNIGSSGEDGVEFDCRPPAGVAPASQVELRCTPIDFSTADSSVAFTVTGRFSDSSDRPVSSRLHRNPGTGMLDLSADFSSLSSTQALVEVFMGGAPVGSRLVPTAPGVVLGSLLPGGGGTPLHLVRCGTLAGSGGGGGGGCGFEMHFDSDFVLMCDGSVFPGDELRVRAADSPLTMTQVSSKVCQGKHFRHVAITLRRTAGGGTPEPQELTFGGLVHSSLGAASLLMRDSDGDGITDLQLHNIGSSGQDGVEIDLRRSQGGAVSFAGNGVSASNFSVMRFDAIDDECPSCVGDDLASVTLSSTGASSMAMAAGGKGCCRGHVIIMKRGGGTEGVGSGGPLYTFAFPFVDDEPWPISADPGSTLLLRYHEWRWVSRPTGSPALAGGVGTGEDELQMRIGLAQESGGGGGTGGTLSGVTVTHPLHGTFTNVEEIVVTRCIDSDAGLVDRGRALFTASGVCAPCTVAIEQSNIAQHHHQHRALGQARLVSEDCDDADPDFGPELWVANIGSSGQDGVEIQLPAVQRDRACDETDPLPDVVGCDGYFKPTDGTFLHRSFSLRGSLVGDDDDDGPLDDVSLLRDVSGTTCQCTCSPGWAGVGARVTGTVRDQFGNVVLAVADLPPSDVCAVGGNDEPGHYSGSFTVTVSSTLRGGAGGGPAHQIEASTQRLEWPVDQTFTFAGMPPVVGRSLELHTQPAVGVTVQGDFRLNAMRCGGQSPAGTTRALGITSEAVVRMPPTPPCPADIVPYATNGDGQVNVTDLLAVIGGWGACASCPATVCVADVTHDCQVNVTDLLAVIGQWGACP